MALEIRHLRAGDEAVLDCVADGVFDNPPTKNFVTEYFGDRQNSLCVAIDDGIVVGFASGVCYNHPDKPREMWINEVGVAPGLQGRGIGRTLVAALLERARELDCDEAWVVADADNVVARALYRSAGGVEQAAVVYVTFALAPSGKSHPS